MDEHEAQFMGETNARFERCFAHLDKLEKDHETLYSLATSVAKLADEIKRNNTRLGIVEADVKAITGKSGQRWDGLVDKVVWLVAGGLIAYALSQIGIGG